MSLVVLAFGALLGAVVGMRATPWLRRGGHRYDDERMPLAPVGWVAPVAAVASALAGVGASVSGDDGVGGVARGLVYAAFTCVLVVLAAIDLDVHRLPNAWTYRLLVVTPVVLLVLALLDAGLGAWLRAVLAGLAVGVLYLLLVLVGGGTGMGLGDLKLAPTLGMLLGYLSWSHALLGTCAGFVLGGVAALILLLARRQDRKSHLAYGPWMIAGTVLVVALPTVSLV